MAPSIDEFEDLTQFADESFDTEEVDLFEFTDDEDSPLLRLKSIVLSLDWDITEEILTELNEELANLRTMWKDDKVAQIYLQGMENVGKYMREEGAYAHPNAIKLLLTLYHNYEKIISSPNISGDSITTMLKADIRKFKVLQYQISTLKKSQGGHDEAGAEATPPDKAKGASASAVQSAKKENAYPPPLRSMEATILGLEWEVTDEGLEKFNTEAMELRNYLSSNTEAQVLIQGLQALGAYIREQKTNAHPDAFTILHSFYDALKMLLESPQLGAEQRRQILIEQISSLNSLKEVIARSAASKAAEQEDADEPESVDKNGLTDEESDDSPAVADEDEMDFSFSFDDEEDSSKPENKVPPAAAPQPAVKPKTVQSPPTSPVKPVEASADDKDEFDDDLFADSSGITPALADEDEEGGFSDSLSSASMSADRAAELDEKLDSFFNFSGEDAEELKPKAVSSPLVEDDTPAAPKKPEKLSLTTILEDEDSEPDEDDGIDSSFFNFDDEHVVTDKAASIDDADDSILNGDDELFSGAAGLADKDKGQRLSETGAESNDEEEEADDELDSFFNFDEDIDVGKSNNALKVAEDEVAVPAAHEEDAEDDTLSSGLDSFFSFDDEAEAEKTESKALPKTAISGEAEEQDSLNLDSGLFGGAEEVVTPALTDEDEIAAPAAHEEDVEDDTLSSGLDSFFSFDDEVEAEKTESKALPETAVSGDDEEQDSLNLDSGLFGGAEEVVTPALTDEDEAVPAAHEEEAEDDTLSSGLDSFFSFDDEVEAEKTERTALPKTAVSGDDEKQVLAGISTDIDVERAAEIKDKLDSLFNFDNELVTSEVAADVQDDIAELDDELITALDDDEVPSSNDFSVSALTDEPEPFTAASADATDKDQDELFGSLNTEEEDAVATSADEQEDAFFAFGKSVLAEEPDLLDEGKPDSSFADAEEDFFGFNTDSENDDAEEALPSADIAADATDEEQDELFGSLNTEDEDAVAAIPDEQEDAFFALSSKPALAEEEEEPEEESVLDEGKSNLFLADAEEDFFGFHTHDNADDEKAEEALSSVDALADATDDGKDELFGSGLNTEEDEDAVITDEQEDEDLLLGQEYEEDSEPAALFGQDEMPDPFSGSSELNESAAETWSADLEEPPSAPIEYQTAALSEILSSLTVVAAALPPVPSGHHLRQVSELAAAARKEPFVPPHQSIMLNLLDSAAAMLAKAPRGTVVSSAIVQELSSGLDKPEDTATLADLINHYTAWQREFFEQLILSQKQQDVAPPEGSSSEEAGLHSVEEKFSQLKQEMMEEFQRLRQELLAMRS